MSTQFMLTWLALVVSSEVSDAFVVQVAPKSGRQGQPPHELTRHHATAASKVATEASAAAFNFEESIQDSTYTQVLSADCKGIADEVRKVYDDLFADPRQPNGARFVFDPWYVTCGDQGTQKSTDDTSNGSDDNELESSSKAAADEQVQYSLKRAQLSQFLQNDDLYGDLINHLSELGRSVGCSCITPPWISLYLNGDQQNFHTDAPHGPLAFVLSITNSGDYGIKFQGGETMLLQPEMLDYWRNYDGSAGLETPSIMQFHPPLFGRCIAFDPRIPHGVTQVHGTNDPRHGRVVIHGWFSEPETIFCGDMFDDDESLQQESLGIIDKVLDPVIELLGSGEIGRACGYLAIRLVIGDDGSISSIASVCDTLIADPEDFRGVVGVDMEGREVLEDPVSDVKLTISENLKDVYFSEKAAGGEIVVPFMFS